MSGYELTAMALGLSMDAFAVTVACCLRLQRVSPRHIFRLAFHFGLFQAMMPLIGWGIGRGAAQFIGACAPWLAAAILFGIGAKAIHEALKNEEREITSDPTRGFSLVAFSLATSIDALGAGLSLAVLTDKIFYAAAVIGAITVGVCVFGAFFGSKAGEKFSRNAELAGGAILILIGVKILTSPLIS